MSTLMSTIWLDPRPNHLHVPTALASTARQPHTLPPTSMPVIKLHVVQGLGFYSELISLGV